MYCMHNVLVSVCKETLIVLLELRLIYRET